MRGEQTYTAQPSRMSHFGELPDVVGGYLTKNLRKCQKSPFLGAKCTNLVTLAETRFQCYQMTALPDMNIFCQILVIFGFFLNFLSNFWQTTSGSSPKCDILEGWQKHVCFLPMGNKSSGRYNMSCLLYTSPSPRD